MRIEQINRDKAGIFSEQHVRMAHQHEDIQKYVGRLFSEEMFTHQIEAKDFELRANPTKRSILVNALERQYASITKNRPDLQRLMGPHCFTVTTGHQLTLLAGPTYFVVKILEVIKLAKELNQKHPTCDIVPVFWMASEDHDFEEIQSTSVFQRNLSVDYEQRGPVGRFSTEKLEAFKAEVLTLFGEDKRAEIEPLLNAYQGANLADATRNLVHHLFGDQGLVIIDGDDQELKQLFSPIVKAELLNGATEAAVQKTNESLEADGFKIQVHVRPINLFYIEDGFRERIVKTENGFEAGQKSWSQSELLELVDTDAARFSPNALLRPVYQETILPNLAYIGGAGEIAYWLQLKGVFDLYRVVYPIIKVRNSIVWIDKTTMKRMDKINMFWTKVFEDVEMLKKDYLQDFASEELDFTHLDELTSNLTNEMEARTLALDPNMKQFVESEARRLEKQLEGLKAKLVKVSKGQHDGAMKAIESIKERLFPGGGLQERSANFLSFCADGEIQTKLDDLYEALDPFSENLIVLMETESTK